MIPTPRTGDGLTFYLGDSLITPDGRWIRTSRAEHKLDYRFYPGSGWVWAIRRRASSALTDLAYFRRGHLNPKLVQGVVELPFVTR